jgi:hypothetical protein
VREVAGETGPVIDLQQQLGDLRAWQHAIRLLHQRLGLLGNAVVQRRDLEPPCLGDGGIGKRIGRGERLDHGQLFLQCGEPSLEEAVTVGLDGQLQRSLLAQSREARPWQQVVLEVFELA